MTAPSNNSPAESTQPVTEGRPLHEMGFADILDTTFSLYRSYFWLFVGIAATLHVPFGIIEILIVSAFGQGDSVQVIVGLLSFVKGLVVHPMVMGALVFAVSQEYIGRKTTIGEAYSRVKFWSILGASLLIMLAMVAMMTIPITLSTLVMVPAIRGTGNVILTAGLMIVVGLFLLPVITYFVVRWSLFCQGIMVEDYRAVGSLRRSRELIKGSWWRVFGVEVVLFIMTSLVVWILGLGLGTFLDQIMGTERLMISIFETILSIIITPIWLIGVTLLYFDLRIRKEAFDIEMMARNIHGEV